MSWEREPLFTKARVYFEKAYDEDKEKSYFGLWCAMGLELLARSALSNISPTLLAEPDKEHQNLLHALNLGSLKTQRKSISTIQVLMLCQTLITDFTEVNFKVSSALINRRNEEVHSGTAAFEEYPTQQWIAGFYKCCKILCEFQGESLNSLFGDEIQKEADLILSDAAEEVVGKTKALIAAHKKVYENKSIESIEILKEDAQKTSDKLAQRGHHRVQCPSCLCTATIIGEPYGKENIEHIEAQIIVKQSILPTKFQCLACELKLNGYYALSAAGIANYYTRRTKYTPEEYYDMINPNDHEKIAAHYHANEPNFDIDIEFDFDIGDEWNND